MTKTTKKKFHNLFTNSTPKTLMNFFKWRLGTKNNTQVKKFKNSIPQFPVNYSLILSPSSLPQITWIGHSTVLIQYLGINILTDPMLSKRASPLPLVGPKRYTKPALSFNKLPPIDYVILSHNHYDHLDAATVKYLGNKPKWIIPSGLASWFHRRNITNVIEKEWWEDYSENELIITCTPAQHWSKRSLLDGFHSLWASWSIQIKDFKFWFAGDTGYNAYQFKEIGEILGPFDAAAIPIGAYEPRWFMKFYHVNPEEAVIIHQDIRSKWSFGIHWGTFALTNEPIYEPPLRLKSALIDANLSLEEFSILGIGETHLIE